MFSLISYLLFLFIITKIQSQDNSIDTNRQNCLCDLTNGICDTSCCCDVDCSNDDRKIFQCNSQSTCFHHIPIYKSNSPHIVQKNGDRICVDYTQNEKIDERFDERQINPNVLPRSINVENSVSVPAGTVDDLSVYQAGSAVFRYITATNTSTYYTLSVSLFNSFACSGFQPITYMQDFSSTCSQRITEDACNNGLDTGKYLSNFCLLKRPSVLAGSISNSDYVCCNGNGATSSWSGSNCLNSLESLRLNIFYSNPNGIQNCTIDLVINPTPTTSLVQTFSVRFTRVGSSSSSTGLRSGSPGYISGAPLIAGNAVGNIINRASGLPILQTSNTGFCSNTNNQVINFGVNVQSTCLYQLTNAGTCPTVSDLLNIFGPNGTNSLFVAAQGNSDPGNTNNNWIRVTFCSSSMGSISDPVCQESSVPNPPSGQCYTRLDIQITYANFGSVTNPQSILGAVTYYFQSVSLSAETTLLLTQTVTFQDISNPPMTEGDQIPRPNTRLPGDFFYPFSLNHAEYSFSFSLIFYLSIIFFLFLI